MTEVILVGSRTTLERRARGVGVTSWSRTGQTAWEELAELPLTNPSWLTAGPGMIYALHGDRTQVSAIRLEADGSLELAATTDCGGSNPVHAIVSDDRLLIANYASGTVARLPIRTDGTLDEPESIVDLNVALTEAGCAVRSHPHQVLVAGDGKRAYVPDKGLDVIFTIGLEGPELSVDSVLRFGPGVGPRHAAFDPARSDRLFVVGELDSTLRTCEIAEDHSLSQISVAATLPDYVGRSQSTAAGIVALETSHGVRIWVSNRGHDSISEFSTDQDGFPRLEASQPCNGRFPRFINVFGDQLVIAHENSDSVSVADISRHTGCISRPRTVARTGSPVSVIAVDPASAGPDFDGSSEQNGDSASS